MKSKKRTFVLAALIGFSAVVGGAFSLGVLGSPTTAEASHSLPVGVSSADLGEGGLDASTIRSVAETESFDVWTARDRAHNICVIAYAAKTGDLSSTCGSERQLAESGIPASLQIGAAAEGDTSVPVLQTYLLPDEKAAAAAHKMIAGSELFGSLVVRYGVMELERTTTIQVPSENGKVSLLVIGRDSLE